MNLDSLRNTEGTDFSRLFYPQSIAIIGASQNKLGGSKYYFANKATGFTDYGGQIYLINPKLKELFGEPVYPSIDDPAIPKPVDYAIISVPAELVPQVVRQLNKDIVRFASIYASGFGESGNEQLDQDLREAIASTDTRFLGPNCLGMLNPDAHVSIYPDWETKVGPISWVAQSGGTMSRLFHMLESWDVGFHYAVSIGNMYDIQAEELLDYFDQDDGTKVIAFYLETIHNGRKFMDVARRVSLHKPIILWKGGQSERGVNAAFSHTGGLAGSFAVWNAMCRQCGIMTATHFEQLADLVQVAAVRPVPPPNLNVAILAAGGGIGVEFTDLFDAAGFTIPDLQPETQEKLGQVFPGYNTSFRNPVDLGEWGYDPRLFAQAMEILLEDPQIGSIVFVKEPERFKGIGNLMDIPDMKQLTIDTLTPILQQSQKPIICTPSPNRDNSEAFEVRHDFQIAMIKVGVPLISYVGNIPHILRQFYEYGKLLAVNNV